MTIQQDVSMSGLSTSVRRAVTIARMTGWTMKANQKQTMMTLYDPTHTHKVVVPYGSVNAGRAESILRQVFRYTPRRELIGILADRRDVTDDPDAATVVALLGPTLLDAALDTVESWDEIPPTVQKMIPAKHAVRRLPGGPDYQRPRDPDPAHPAWVGPLPGGETEAAIEGCVETPYEGRTPAGIEAYVWSYGDGRTEYVCKAHPEPQVFRSLQALNGHGRSHGTDPTKPLPLRGQQAHVATAGAYQCSVCDRTFGKSTALGAHRWRAHGIRGESASAEKYRAARDEKASQEEMAGRQIAVRVHGAEMARVPWAARRGSGGGAGPGTMYQSPVVDQVTYADGHIGFVCKGCDDYVSDHPQSVARHAGQVHPGLANQAEVVQFHVPDYEPSGMKQRTNPRLQHVITEALDAIAGWQQMTADELAHAISEHIMENKPDSVPAEPLTDAEILTRIVRLVDRGQYAQLQQAVDSLSGQVRELAESEERRSDEVLDAMQERDRALARVQALIEERAALRDMLAVAPEEGS